MNRPAEYFYRVTEFVTTMVTDPDNKNSFTNEQEFKGKDLTRCKEDAYLFYRDRLRGFENGNVKFFLPFAGPLNYEFNKNSAYSITLSFVVNDGTYETEFPIEGEDERTHAESREVELLVWKEKGIIKQL